MTDTKKDEPPHARAGTRRFVVKSEVTDAKRSLRTMDGRGGQCLNRDPWSNRR